MGNVTGIFKKISPSKLWDFLEAYALLYGAIKSPKEKYEPLSRIYKSKENLEALILEGVLQNKGLLGHYLLNNKFRWNLLAFSIFTKSVPIIEAFADSGDFDLDAPVSPKIGLLELSVSNNLIEVSELLASRGVGFIDCDECVSPLDMYMFYGKEAKTGLPVSRPENLINQDILEFINRIESGKLRLIQ